MLNERLSAFGARNFTYPGSKGVGIKTVSLSNMWPLVFPGARGDSAIARVCRCVDLVQEALSADFLCRLLRWWCRRLSFVVFGAALDAGCCVFLPYFLRPLAAAFPPRGGDSRVHSLLLRSLCDSAKFFPGFGFVAE